MLTGMAYEGSWPDGEPEDEDISEWSYSGESFELYNYLESWDVVLEKIENGQITENNLAEWLQYFKDSENFEYDIEIWKE